MLIDVLWCDLVVICFGMIWCDFTEVWLDLIDFVFGVVRSELVCFGAVWCLSVWFDVICIFLSANR